MPAIIPTLAASDPLSHVLDKPNVIGPLSMNMVTLIVASILTVLLVLGVAKRIGTGPESEGGERYVTKGRLAQLVEVIILYLRDNVLRPQLGHAADKFAPFLLTIFFFILVNNLLGLFPLMDIQHLIGKLLMNNEHFAVIGGTATGRLWVTAALATVAFVVIHVSGFRSAGAGGYFKHFLGGGPWYLAPIMVPVEIMGTVVKPSALAIRLFANMTAGHVMLAVLMIFTAAAPAALGWLGAPISLAALLAGVAIFFLELFVAFLQAYIFMFLTTLFIAQFMHHHHDEHAHAEHYDEHHPASHDAAAVVSAV